MSSELRNGRVFFHYIEDGEVQEGSMTGQVMLLDSGWVMIIDAVDDDGDERPDTAFPPQVVLCLEWPED